MKSEAPVLAGNLLLPPQGLLSQLKKWQKKYCRLFKFSNNGLARLEVYDSEEQALKHSTTRNIVLDTCVKIAQEPQKHQPYIIAITMKTEVYHLAALNGQDLSDWLLALQEVAFKGIASGVDYEEDNVLYYSIDAGVFTVDIVQNEAAERCGLKGTYYLVLGNNSLMLRLDREGKILYVWPYKYIRRYGHGDGKFIFESGRHCDSGEGVFKFLYHKCEDIHNALAEILRNIQRMENVISADTFPTRSDSLGSLPSIPNEPMHTEQTDSTLLLDSKSTVTKPKKPPRKSIKTGTTKSVDQVEMPEDAMSQLRPPLPNPRRTSDLPEPFYDSVSTPKDAWKTLGINEVPHQENLPQLVPKLQDYATVLDAKNMTIDFEKPEGTKIVPLTLSKTQKDESYDHLQHFGIQSPSTPSKPFLSADSPLSTEHVYRRVNSKPRNTPMVEEGAYATYNDDDQLNLSSCRLADDSHTGYALIQKPKHKIDSTSDNLLHYDCNGSEYAIISKTV